MNKLVFFFQTKERLSDEEKIFLDLAIYIAAQKKYEVYYANNWFQCDMDEKYSALKYLNPLEIKNMQFMDATFFTSVNYLPNLLSVAQNFPNAKICLLSYSVDCINKLIKNIHCEKTKNNLIDMIVENKSCSYLNYNCFLKEKYKCKDDDIFIARCLTDELSQFEENKIINPDEINIAYFGDINEMACNVIKTTLQNLKSNILSDRKINIHFVGNVYKIFRFNDSYFKNKLKIFYTGNINESMQRKDYLINNADIVIAINNHALEAASYNLPVAIPIYDKNTCFEDNYILLSDVKKYIYSWTVDDINSQECVNYSFGDILREVYVNDNKTNIAFKCHNYLSQNATLEEMAKRAITLIDNTKLTIEKCMSQPEIIITINKYNEFINTYGEDKDFNDYIKYKIDGERQYKKVAKIDVNNNDLFHYKKFMSIQRQYSKKINVIKKKDKIKVAFLVTFKQTFSSQAVFDIMLNDSVFDPYIIVIPDISGTMKAQRELFNDTYYALKEKYKSRVLQGYNIDNDEYMDLNDEYSVIFFSNPYSLYDHKLHNYSYFLDKNAVLIYLNYGFPALKFWEEIIHLDFYNSMWKVCIENDSNKKYLKDIQTIKGRNALVTGYIKMDGLANEKIIDDRKKTILLCPHHTVSGWEKLNISNFLKYADLFLNLPKMYPDVNFIFRPHPFLFKTLLAKKIWSEEKLNKYIEDLVINKNMLYDTSDYYLDKFANSDAMIHDCGSFIAEYLYTKKPCCYMLKSKDDTYNGLVPFGQKCMDQYYHAFDENDIIEFIDKVVMDGNDPKKLDRIRFVEEELMINYPNAAQGLVDYLKKELR